MRGRGAPVDGGSLAVKVMEGVASLVLRASWRGGGLVVKLCVVVD